MQDATLDASCGSQPELATLPILDLNLRQADSADLNRLTAFYLVHGSAALPAPTIALLGTALTAGRVLLIETDRSQPILAAAAVFDLSPAGWRSYVGELSGTCVTRELNGYGPISLQRILLAARVLGYVALNNEVSSDASSTLVVIVKADNERSIRNIEAAGFARLESRPGWIDYEERVWLGAPAGPDWIYYIADENTAMRAYDDLVKVGVFTGGIALNRTNRASGEVETIRLRVLLPDIMIAEGDLHEIAAGRRPVGLSPLPETLIA